MKLVIKVSVFIVVFFIIANILAFFLKNDKNTYSRLVMYDFYDQKQIDYLFCGASHVSHGINPQVLSKQLNKNIFCLGTSAQKISTTYFLIKEAINKYNLQTVFVDLDFGMAIGEPKPFLEKEPSKDMYIVSSYLRNPLIKTQYLLSMTSPKYYINSFFPLGIYKDISLDPRVFIKNIKSKIITKDYFNYKYESKTSDYIRGGVILKESKIEDGSFYNFEENISKIPESINSEWQKYVKKIIDLCKKNNVSLFFYSAPIPDYFLTASGDYDLYHSFVKSFLASFGYVFYDFSLCRQEYLNLKDSDYYDYNHLNKDGIDKFTYTFSEILEGKITPEQLFFSSYKEKKENHPPCIYGILINQNVETGLITASAVSNISVPEKINFAVYEVNNSNENLIVSKENSDCITFTKQAGKIKIKTFYEDIEQTVCTVDF